MKKLLIAGLCGFGLVVSGCMTMPTPTDKKMDDLIEIIDVPNKTKVQIFEDSRIWIAQSFKSANNVIQYADKDTGSIVGKGNIAYPCDGFVDCGAFGKDKINFTIKIDSKDNKARVTISDITRTNLTYVQGGYNANIGKELPINLVEHQQKITMKLKDVVGQYKTAITSSNTNQNW